MTQTTTATPVIQVYTSNIERNPQQPRQWFDNEELEQLSISVREHGIIQPLIVTPSSKPDVYILIAGERRLIASRRANLETDMGLIDIHQVEKEVMKYYTN